MNSCSQPHNSLNFIMMTWFAPPCSFVLDVFGCYVWYSNNIDNWANPDNNPIQTYILTSWLHLDKPLGKAKRRGKQMIVTYGTGFEVCSRCPNVALCPDLPAVPAVIWVYWNTRWGKDKDYHCDMQIALRDIPMKLIYVYSSNAVVYIDNAELDKGLHAAACCLSSDTMANIYHNCVMDWSWLLACMLTNEWGLWMLLTHKKFAWYASNISG